MGFNKRYLDKEIIMCTIKNNDSISKLINVDCLITDSWSERFLNCYNSKYQGLRDKLAIDTRFSSNNKSIYDHKNFSKINNIKNLSNILENLVRDPNWVEVIFTLNLLGDDDIDDKVRGKFDKLKDICVKKIINYYTIESRDKVITNILS